MSLDVTYSDEFGSFESARRPGYIHYRASDDEEGQRFRGPDLGVIKTLITSDGAEVGETEGSEGFEAVKSILHNESSSQSIDVLENFDFEVAADEVLSQFDSEFIREIFSKETIVGQSLFTEDTEAVRELFSKNITDEFYEPTSDTEAIREIFSKSIN